MGEIHTRRIGRHHIQCCTQWQYRDIDEQRKTNMVKRAKNEMKILAFYEIAYPGCCMLLQNSSVYGKRIDIFNLMKYFISH